MRCSAVGVLLATFLSACGDEDKPAPLPPGSCSAQREKQLVYGYMLDYYLWFDQIPSPLNLGSYASAEDLLQGVIYEPLDRWSYIVPLSVDQAYYGEGAYVGLGLSMQFDSTDRLRITQVFSGSPADAAGLKRGDFILSVNGYAAGDLASADNWSNAFGPDGIGVTVTMTVQDPSGASSTLTLHKAKVVLEPVQLTTTFDHAGRKVGYVLFGTFIEPAVDALRQAFAQLQSSGVDELVLDLRYNGGGALSVAAYLASLIGGTRTADQILFALHHNSKHSALDDQGYFSSYKEALSLPRVVILATRDTASASELVMNGLAPFVTVIQVGSATHGKPVGMEPYEFCDKVLVPITFSTANSAGTGDYYDGLAPTCVVADDLDHELGDTAEAMLAEALYYVENGACLHPAPPPTGLASQAPAQKRVPLTGFSQLVGAL